MTPPVAFGVGATKAGTSWLYRALADHPGCHLPPVKELHYWDSFDPAQAAWQARAFRRNRDGHLRAAEAAREAGDGARVASRLRQAAALDRLAEIVEGPRAGDGPYRDFLLDGAQGRLVADVTPAYALADAPTLRRMIEAFPESRVVYLVRDPVARLWSHLRMEATRSGAPEAEVGAKANALLRRFLDEGAPPGVALRGDYPAAVARLREAVPPARLCVEYAERLFTDQGWRDLQAFLGLDPRPAPREVRHSGVDAPMDEPLRRRISLRLRPHYDWAAREVGPLPPAWAATLERTAA